MDPPPPPIPPSLPKEEKTDKTKEAEHSQPHSENGVGETEGSGANTGPVDTSKSRPRRKSEKDKKLKKEDKQNIIKYFNQTINSLVKKKYGKKGFYYPFKSAEIMITLAAVKKILKKEPPMIEMKVPVVIVGDLHGQYSDLIRIFDMFRDDTNPGYLNTRYVFLGDYVDRGRQSLEIIMILFMLKVLYPRQFALLRGNHECRAINKAYGFAAEIRERFLDPKKSLEIFEGFNEVFTHLPLSCLVADSILCMHGGISSKMKTRDDIMKIPKPLKDVSTNPIATDLLWADPMIGLPWFDVPNKVRGVSVYFGEETLDNVLNDLNLTMVFRGHQMMMNGFNFYHNKLITVFSAAAYYPDKPNRGAICCIGADGRIGFKVIIPHPPDHPDSQCTVLLSPTVIPSHVKMFRGEHDTSNDHDTGYVTVAPQLAAALAHKEEAKKSREERGASGQHDKEEDKEKEKDREKEKE
ncbi:hypothetical protein PRIPAC_81428 [Pristionchus pacificus]|nr:hypothetical protein PRIPAC_81428 [Pristionchus pacificus]|eukprot:PDM73111.1 Calcineurin-like phosphoesterase [Pristionchus pacificus]